MTEINTQELLELIHPCLQELHLMRTARCLEEETGEQFKNPPIKSLKEIVNTYKSLSKLFLGLISHASPESTLDTNNNIEKKKQPQEKVNESKESTKSKKKKKKKNEKEKELNDGKENSNSETSESTNKKEVTKKVTKPKSQPLVPPGEWVFPEMEGPLTTLFEKLCAQVGSKTNKHFVESNEKKEGFEREKKASLDFEESDVEYPTEEVNKVLIKLSNGDVYESPSGIKKKSGTEEEDTDADDTSKHKKGKDTNKETNKSGKDILIIAEESAPFDDSDKLKKKKKKKRKTEEAEENSPKKKKIEDDTVNETTQDEETTAETMVDDVEKPKKKKKKKKKDSVEKVNETTTSSDKENFSVNQNTESEEKESPTKKKKKKKKNKHEHEGNIANGFLTDDAESQDDFVSPVKKNKVKTPSSKNTPFRRIKEDEIVLHDKLADNSYEAKKGSQAGYGEKANQILKKTKGKGFRHEKTKKKRGNYVGGNISTQVNSISFDEIEE